MGNWGVKGFGKLERRVDSGRGDDKKGDWGGWGFEGGD